MKRNSIFGAQIVFLLLLIFLTELSAVFTGQVYAVSENEKTTIARGYFLTMRKESNITLNGEEIITNETPVLIIHPLQGNGSLEVDDYWAGLFFYEMSVINSDSKEMLLVDATLTRPKVVTSFPVGGRYFLPPQNITKYYDFFTPKIKALAANAPELLKDKGIDGLVSLFDPLTLPVFVLKNNTDSLPLFITPKYNYNERVRNQDQEYHHYFEELAAQNKIRLIKNKLSQSRFVNRYSVDSSSWEVAFECEDQDFKLLVSYVSHTFLSEHLVFWLHGNVSLELLNKHTNDTLSIKQAIDFSTWALRPAGGEDSDSDAPILEFPEILALLIPVTVYYFNKKSIKNKKREKEN